MICETSNRATRYTATLAFTAIACTLDPVAVLLYVPLIASDRNPSPQGRQRRCTLHVARLRLHNAAIWLVHRSSTARVIENLISHPFPRACLTAVILALSLLNPILLQISRHGTVPVLQCITHNVASLYGPRICPTIVNATLSLLNLILLQLIEDGIEPHPGHPNHLRTLGIATLNARGMGHGALRITSGGDADQACG